MKKRSFFPPWRFFTPQRDELESERDALRRTVEELQSELLRRDERVAVLEAGLQLLQNARNEDEGLYASEAKNGGTSHFADVAINPESIDNPRFEKFPYAGPFPWLDRPDAELQIAAKLAAGLIDETEAAACRFWRDNGYLIVERAVEPDVLDQAWSAYEKAVADGTVQLQPETVSPDDPWPGRFLDPHLKVPALCGIMRHPAILRWVRLLMEREPAPFQTITSHKGSQQGAHSDSIHMTTYPLGYLTASWVAFEDIHPDSGPLVYYPGSHRLPYIFSKDIGITQEDFRQNGYKGYLERYEPRIKELVVEAGIEPHYFHAKKGDVLIWHANLIHGGSTRRDVKHSRRAIVNHYFVKGAHCYHDLAASQPRPFAGTCLVESHVATSASAR